MLIRRVFLGCVATGILALAVLTSGQAQAPSTLLLIRGATIIDGISDAPLRDRALLIEGNTIRDVLPDHGVLIDELTQVGYAARSTYEARLPRSFISSGARPSCFSLWMRESTKRTGYRRSSRSSSFKMRLTTAR